MQHTPVEEHTSGYMTEHDYTRGMKFDRVESGAGKYLGDKAIQLLGELPQALRGRQWSAGWHTTQHNKSHKAVITLTAFLIPLNLE